MPAAGPISPLHLVVVAALSPPATLLSDDPSDRLRFGTATESSGDASHGATSSGACPSTSSTDVDAHGAKASGDPNGSPRGQDWRSSTSCCGGYCSHRGNRFDCVVLAVLCSAFCGQNNLVTNSELGAVLHMP